MYLPLVKNAKPCNGYDCISEMIRASIYRLTKEVSEEAKDRIYKNYERLQKDAI